MHSDTSTGGAQSNLEVQRREEELIEAQVMDVLLGNTTTSSSGAASVMGARPSSSPGRPYGVAAKVTPKKTPSSFASLKERNAAHLNNAASPIIRSLLTPLVDHSFTSVFATGALSSTPPPPSLLGVSPSSGFFHPFVGLSTHRSTSSALSSTRRPVGSALCPGTAAGQRSFGVGAGTRPGTTQTGRGTRGAGTNSEPRPQTMATGRSTDGANRQLDFSAPEADADGRDFAAQRISAAGMSRSHSAAGLAAQQGKRPGTSAAGERPTTAKVRPTTAAPGVRNIVNQAAGDTYANNGSNANHSLSPWTEESAHPPVGHHQRKLTIDAHTEDPVSNIPSPIHFVRSPIRHTRTSSLGSFLKLQASGVERQPSAATTPSPYPNGSPYAYAIWEIEGGSSSAGTAPISEDESEETHEMVSVQSKPAAASTDPRSSLGRATSLSSFAPGAYASGNTTAFTKQSFKDDRAEALMSGQKVVLESHQALYSRNRSASPLPGQKANPAFGESSLTKEEMEQLRIKRLYSFVAPKVGPDTPSVFSKVMALSENLPGKLLASKNANSSKIARADEKRVAAATREGGISKIILNSFTAPLT
jgi:hypothetical protein